jgi:ribosomal protein S18 acetylase RimI-like enzyme
VSVDIRVGVPADAAVLAEFAVRTFREAFGAENNPDDLARHLAESYGTAQQLAELSDPRIVTLLFEVDEQLTGYAQLRWGRVPACVDGPDPVEVRRLYVERAWHGRGAGQALMERVNAEVYDRGGRTIWLGVWERNDRAIAFYKKAGFADVGSHVFMVGTDAQTDRVMVRPVERPSWYAEPVPPVTVRIRLHRGDARTVVAPVAVIGDRSPLRTWLEQEHGAVFVPVLMRQRFLPSVSRARVRQASPPSGPWRHVTTVHTDVRRNAGTRLSNDLSDTLDFCLREWSPSEIVVLPLTWREPQAVVMNTLMAFWVLAYYSAAIFRRPWPDPEFILPSLDGTDGYLEALEHDAAGFYDWLAPIFARDAFSFFGPKPVLDRARVTFDRRV